MLWLTEKHKDFAKNMLEFSQDKTFNFPMSTILINVTNITMTLLFENILKCFNNNYIIIL